MKISQLSLEALMMMTSNEKWSFICADATDNGESADVGLLLGSRPEIATERALGAACLYHSGRIKHIVSSGGVRWEHNGEMISEADIMAQTLIESNVPEDAVIMEDQALTTRENMICGTLQINRKTRFNNVNRVTVITSFWHMKRSLALAKTFLPRGVTVYGYPVLSAQSREEWLRSEDNVRLLDSEIRLLKDLADTRIIEDIEMV